MAGALVRNRRNGMISARMGPWEWKFFSTIFLTSLCGRPFCRYLPIAWTLNQDSLLSREEVNPMAATAPEPDPEAHGPQAQGSEAQGPEVQGPQAQAGADLPEGQSGPSGRRFTWVPGSEQEGHELSGPVPPEALPGGQQAGAGPVGLDWQALLDALAASGLLDGDPESQDAELAQELEAEKDGRMGPPLDPARLAALAIEYMEPGPGLAGWLELAAGAATSLDEYDLTGLAIAARKQAAHANGVELTAVAQITSRAAAADRRVGVSVEGRPARVCRDAAGQVEMALRLSHDGAQAWADLALTLTWRLPRTLAALAVGWIDLERAQIIARATSVLTEQAARAVEATVLPEARRKTYAELRDWLHHLVVAADPDGAEERRQKAQRNADVRLYADEDQTATLVADKLPQIESASGFARINALARARKASGLPGSLGLHRAQVLLGLILGTDPPPVPADDAPPSQPPPPAGDPGPRSGPHPDNGPRPDGRPGSRGRPGRSPQPLTSPDELPVPPDELPPPPDGPLPGGDLDPADDDLAGAGDGRNCAGSGQGAAPDNAGLDDAVDPSETDDDPYGTGPTPAWPALGSLPPGLARPARADGTPPAAGLLDVTLPWTAFAGLADRPGTLGRIGAITPAQARQLALAAASDPAAQWRVIVTSPDGHAIAVTRIRRRARPATATGSPRDGPPAARGPAGRVSLTISQDTVAALANRGALPPGNTGPPQKTRPPGRAGPRSGTGPADRIIAAALRSAARALQRALVQADVDAAVGGCAHTTASSAYRPPPRLREYVIARDLTCRNPVCRQPAWRADLDHTIPWEGGGLTCACNLSGECRRDHQLKQHPRWTLRQIKPGWFEWTAPSGRTYTSEPATYIT
jgi:hypothetical protein